jgi:hypothetical protein
LPARRRTGFGGEQPRRSPRRDTAPLPNGDNGPAVKWKGAAPLPNGDNGPAVKWKGAAPLPNGDNGWDRRLPYPGGAAVGVLAWFRKASWRVPGGRSRLPSGTLQDRSRSASGTYLLVPEFEPGRSFPLPLAAPP